MTTHDSYGRWLSPDPLGGDITNPQSLNRYAYALNNPTTNTDPLGLQGCEGGSSNFAPPFPGAIQVSVSAPCPGDGDSLHYDSLYYYEMFGMYGPTGTYYAGHGGGGGGGGGAPPPKPAPPSGPLPSSLQITKQVNQCAGSYANQHSLANELGISNVPVLGSVFSNDVATLSNIVFGPNRAGGAGSLLLSNPTNVNAVAGGARLISALPNPFASPTINVTVSGAAVSTEAFGLTAVSVDVSKTVPTIGESALGKVAGGVLNALTAFKAPYDAAFYINGLAACSGFPHF